MDLQKSEQQDPRKLMDQAFNEAEIKNKSIIEDPFRKGSTVISAKQLTKTQLKQLENGRISNTNTQTNSIEYNEFDFLKKLKSSNPPNQNMSSYDYQAAAVRRKNQAEIKRLRYELNSINEEANYTTGMIKKTKYKILIKKEQLNDSKKISDLFTFLFIVCALILYVGSKKNTVS